MKRLGNCCFCIDLETGGKIIGWLNFISAIIGMGIMAFALIAAFWFSASSGDGTAVIIALSISIFVIPICAILALIARKLITGINERDASKVRIFKKFSVVMLVLYILGQLGNVTNPRESVTFNQHGDLVEESMAGNIIVIIISILWSLYVIYVIHSIEEKFNEEKLPTTQPGVISYQPVQQGFNNSQQQSPLITSQPYAPPPQNTPYPPTNYDFTTTKK